jgi:site-specific DNA-methyltransferase (adenine-specific)
MTRLPRNQILLGDVIERLEGLPSNSVDCVVTSPPFYQLRDYGVVGQIGLEPTIHLWEAKMTAVLQAVRRVLKPTGGVWIDLGDSYARSFKQGAAPKSLLLGPERLLLSLSKYGWIVRNKVIWAKTNPMPTSVSDRLNTTYDVIYFLVRSRRYFFDLDAIREPHLSKKSRPSRAPACPVEAIGPLSGPNLGLTKARDNDLPGHALGKNPGDVWQVSTQGFHGAHFATFPTKLIERPILATCPERICTACDQPWHRPTQELIRAKYRAADEHVRRYPHRWRTVRRLGELRPVCTCRADHRPGVVLDPFYGSGTVGVVAERLRRDWIGIELKPDYIKLAQQRLQGARQQLRTQANTEAAA